jgi:hypothetical protein
MRKLDWFLLAVIGVFLAGALAAQALGGALSAIGGGEHLVERLVSPRADSPMSAQCPTIFIRRR